MTNASDNNIPDLLPLEEDCRRQRSLVDHVRDLLGRADERRLAEPENRRRWNRVLDNLEVALDEAKARLERAEFRLAEARRRGTLSPSSSPSEPETPAPEPELAADVDACAFEAARRLLAAPLEEAERASLEQVALARNYLERHGNDGERTSAERRLAARVELAVQAQANARPASPDPYERRKQTMLRQAMNKALDGDLGGLTLREMDLLVGSYAVLLRRRDLSPKEERLCRILLRIVTELERILAGLRAQRD
jgi:hypothetical protein